MLKARCLASEVECRMFKNEEGANREKRMLKNKEKREKRKEKNEC